MKRKQHAQAGFTLLELLIVVIILGVLAAIVIPQLSSSTADANESALDSNLATLRRASELFHVHHGFIYPGSTKTNQGNACAAIGGTKGTGEKDTAQAWMDHLLMFSDLGGKTCSLYDATSFKYGPYVRKIPSDPFTGKGSVVTEIVVTSTGTRIVPGSPAGGWAVDTKSGQIVMNSNANDSKGNGYYTH